MAIEQSIRVSQDSPLTAKPGSKERVPAWLLVFGAVFVCSWCGNQFSPLLLLYKDDGYSSLAVTGFLAIYVLGLAPALLRGSALSDRHGRQPLMGAALLAAIAASSCLALGAIGPVGICLGRLLSGVSVGLAIAVGSSWLKEVSQPPFAAGADRTAGARRASVAFALGSASGALLAGSIAQFTAWGEVLPYLLHILLTAPFLWLLLQVPETGVALAPAAVRRRAPIDPRFRLLLLLAAPWIFAAAAIGYGYLPVLLEDATQGWGLAYATLLTVVALSTAALVQPFAKGLAAASASRGLALALAVLSAGLLLAAGAEAAHSPVLGVLVNVLLGAGIGIGLVSGLVEAQRLAGPANLAALTGAFYAAAYSGFLLPVPMAALTPPLTSLGLLAGLSVLAGLCCLAVLAAEHRTASLQSAPAVSH